MAYNITIKEITEMKRFGHTMKAWYKNSKGIPFHKYFTTEEEYRDFTNKVFEADGRIVARRKISE